MMGIRPSVLALTLGALCATPVFSQDERRAGPPPPPVPAEAPATPGIPISDDSAAGAEQWERFFGQRIVRNVSRAALYPVLPEASASRGRAVIVLPGGGHLFVSMENEGLPVAEALAEAGYAAFVLKYRTRSTPPDAKAFMPVMGEQFRNLGKRRPEPFPAAVDDVLAALAYVEQRCEALGCTEHAPALLGFSAGARTIICALEQSPEELAGSDVALLYPPTLDPIAAKPRPPLFLALAQDDPLFVQGGFTLAEDWVQRGGSLEFHLYSGGGHGFGMSALGGGRGTSADWLDDYLRWLEAPRP